MNDTIIYGFHAVEASLNQQNVNEIWLQKDRKDKRLKEIYKVISDNKIPHQTVTRAELDQLTHHAKHQGVAARTQALTSGTEKDLDTLLDTLNDAPFLLILDGIQDPGNLGACLRSAAAAGVHAVITPKDRAASLNATVRKVASGGAETVPFIQVTNLARTLQNLKQRGIWTAGLAGEAQETLYQLDLTGPLALIAGAEGGGMRRLTKKHCDFLAKIPMTDAIESLNVSVSTGIGLFEAVRQRKG